VSVQACAAIGFRNRERMCIINTGVIARLDRAIQYSTGSSGLNREAAGYWITRFRG